VVKVIELRATIVDLVASVTAAGVTVTVYGEESTFNPLSIMYIWKVPDNSGVKDTKKAPGAAAASLIVPVLRTV
jgi:hypothetical protein